MRKGQKKAHIADHLSPEVPEYVRTLTVNVGNCFDNICGPDPDVVDMCSTF